MNGKTTYPNPDINEAEPMPPVKQKRASGPIPSISPRELYAERNWSALAGLALIVVGLLYLIQDILGIHLNLWSLVMIGLGGWLMVDGWQTYVAHQRTWVESSRNRFIGGAVILLVGLFGTLRLSTWSWFLMAISAWLLFDARQKYEKNGRVWTEQSRNRMIGGIAVGVIALFGLLSVWHTWPLLLIAVGAVLLFGRLGKHCC